MELSLDDFDYLLPPELVAQTPSRTRTGSRLMRLASDGVSDHAFADLPQFLSAGDLLIFNDTKVIKARLFGAKSTGGQVEVLIERVIHSHEALAHIRSSHAPKAGARLRLADTFWVEVVARHEHLFHLRFESDSTVFDLLDRYGDLPLPPYITHRPDADDNARYQTVYAREAGAVAAPTAGLHFDQAMLATLQARGIALSYLTLHVGAGTFQPVRVARIEDHHMHREWYRLSEATVQAIAQCRAQGGRVICVGTTSLRALESAALRGPLHGHDAETDIFIRPGFRFQLTDRLITNFHLPKSTLLMLIAAFAGLKPVQRAYAHAIEARYRFFSYGDAMLIDRQDHAISL